LRDDDLSILAVEVGALDRAVIDGGIAHVGPIDVTRRHIHSDAVGKAAIGDDGLAVGTIGIHRVYAVPAQFENEQSSRARRAGRSLRSGLLEYAHGQSFRFTVARLHLAGFY